MSALGLLALTSGWSVSGTDRDAGPALDALSAAGARVQVGHDAAAIAPDADAVFVSTAIGDDNPEVVAARERGLPVLHRSDLLAMLISKPGRVFTREELMSHVWGEMPLGGNRTVDVHVAQLRAKFGDRGRARGIAPVFAVVSASTSISAARRSSHGPSSDSTARR